MMINNRYLVIAFGVASLLLLVLAYALRRDVYVFALFIHILVWIELVYLSKLVFAQKNGSYAAASVLVFGILFILIAPSVQLLTTQERLVNTLVIDESSLANANLQFFFLYLGFILAYKNGRLGAKEFTKLPNENIPRHDTIRAIVYLLISLGSFTLTYAITSDIYAEKVAEDSDLSMSPLYLIKTKFIGFLPIPILLSIIISKGREIFKNPLWTIVFLVALTGVITSQNPILEKRQSIGPVYLSIIAAIALGYLRSGFSKFLFIFAALVVAMPLIAILTHTNVTNWSDSEFDFSVIFDHFVELHYDAWANAAAAYHMIEFSGLYWGKQLLGAVLFWVPREIWDSKPHMSGVEIARFLQSFYSMWFENISAPLATEGYIDFWYIGSILYGVILARVCKKLDDFVAGDYSAVIVGAGIFFSFFLIFIMRGALMNAAAYGFGNFLAFLVIYLIDRHIIGYKK